MAAETVAPKHRRRLRWRTIGRLILFAAGVYVVVFEILLFRFLMQLNEPLPEPPYHLVQVPATVQLPPTTLPPSPATITPLPR